MSQSKRIAVIGAGIAGLSAAYELKRAGFEVVVYEKNSYPGGRMMTRLTEGMPFDGGADFLINGWYSLLQSYAKELGVVWQLSEEGGRPRIIRDKIPYYIDVVGPSVLNFKLLSLKARIKFFLFIAKIKFFSGKLNFFDLSQNSPALDELSAAEYLRKNVHPEVLEYIADPFTSVMQFHRADEISASALIALIQAMLDVTTGFRMAYTPGGMGMIPEALAKNVGVRYGVDVVSVAEKDGRVEVVHGTGAELFDSVIVATTGEIAVKILKNFPESAREMFDALRYSTTMTLAFKIPQNLFPDNAHLNYVPFVENQIIAGYDNTVRKDRGAVKDGNSLLNVYLHEDAAKKYSSKADTEIFDLVKEELLLVCPEARAQSSDVFPFAIKRWSHAMPKFTGGYSKTVRLFLEEGQGVGHIYLAGDYLNSPWTEGAARCGKRVAHQIVDYFTR